MYWPLLFLLAAIVLAYAGAGIRSTTITFAAATLSYAIFGHSLLWLLVLLVLLTTLLSLNAESLRQEWFTQPALRYFRRVAPQFSPAEHLWLPPPLGSAPPPAESPAHDERPAIVPAEAPAETAAEPQVEWQAERQADWARELLRPRADWERRRRKPLPLSAAERQWLDGPCATLCRLTEQWQLQAPSAAAAAVAPAELWQFLRRYGFLSQSLSRSNGGLGHSPAAISAAHGKLASAPGGLAVLAVLNRALLAVQLLQDHGSPTQKHTVLPGIADGSVWPTLALPRTRAGASFELAGADAWARIVESATPGDSSETPSRWALELHLRLQDVAGIEQADYFLLPCTVYDPDRRLGGASHLGCSLLLLRRETPGLACLPDGQTSGHGDLRGQALRLPLDTLLGGPAQLGHGRRQLTAAAAHWPARCEAAGLAGAALYGGLNGAALARLQQHRGVPRNRYVVDTVAQVGAQTYALHALRNASGLSAGEPLAALAVSLESRRRADHIWPQILQLAGPAARHRRAGALLQQASWTAAAVTAPLAPEQRLGSTDFGLAVLHGHLRLRAALLAAAEENPAKALEDFDLQLWPQLGRIAAAAARSFVLGLCGGLLAPAPPGSAKRLRQRLSRYGASLCLLCDLALLAPGDGDGPPLLRDARLARWLSEAYGALYTAAAAIEYWEHHDSPAEDWVFVDYLGLDACRRAQTALSAALRHLPSYSLRGVARLLVFPAGHRARAPSATLAATVAERLTQPGGSRQRLLDAGFAPANGGGALARIDAALSAWLAVEPLALRLATAIASGRLPDVPQASIIDTAFAVGLLDADEAQRLRAARDAVDSILASSGDGSAS